MRNMVRTSAGTCRCFRCADNARRIATACDERRSAISRAAVAPSPDVPARRIGLQIGCGATDQRPMPLAPEQPSLLAPSPRDAPRSVPPGLGGEPPRRRSWWPWVLVAVVVLVGLARIAVVVASHLDDGRPHVAPPAGFTADVGQRPAVGEWRATGRTTSTAGYLGSRDVGETIVRRWTTARRCAARRCSFVLTRELADGKRLRSPLTPGADGWHAT